MATNNAVNIRSAGIVKYDGSSAFSAVTTTQYNVLVGDTANGIASITPTSNSGYVLTSNGLSANPSFQVLPTRIATLDGDSGGATGSTVTINGSTNGGKTVKFTGTSATLSLNVSDSTTRTTFIGYGNGSTITGNIADNTSVGVNCMPALNGTDGHDNVAIGSNCMQYTTGCNYNTVVGSNALTAISSGGNRNVAIGFNSLYSNQTGSDNVSVGPSAMGGTGTGNVTRNTAIGSGALYATTTGYGNTCVGYDSMGGGNGSQSYNAGLGYWALSGLAGSGSYNVAVGYNSGSNYSNNGESSNICLNNTGVAAESNTLRIGAGTGTGQQQLNSAYICGINGIVVTGAAVLVSSSNQLGVASSSKKFKKDIQDMADDSAAILKLRPVTFLWDKDSAPGLKDASDERQFGVIAEEAAEIVPSLVNYTSDGKIVGFKYNELPAILLNELQKALKRIEILEEKLK